MSASTNLEARIFRRHRSDHGLQSKVCLLLVKVLDEGAFFVPLEARQKADVKDDVDLLDQDAVSFGIHVLESVRGSTPLSDLVGAVRRGSDAVCRVRLIAEQAVGDGYDKCLLQIGISGEDASADRRPRKLLGRHVFVDIFNRQDHSLVAAVALKDVDPVTRQLAGVGQVLKRGESCNGVLAE